MLADELLRIIKDIEKNKAEGQNLEIKTANKGCPKRLYDTYLVFQIKIMGE